MSFNAINGMFNTARRAQSQNGIDMPPTKAQVDTWESDCKELQRDGRTRGRRCSGVDLVEIQQPADEERPDAAEDHADGAGRAGVVHVRGAAGGAGGAAGGRGGRRMSGAPQARDCSPPRSWPLVAAVRLGRAGFRRAPALYADLTWRCTGPFDGGPGRVREGVAGESGVYVDHDAERRRLENGRRRRDVDVGR